jgi:hypothetical protein
MSEENKNVEGLNEGVSDGVNDGVNDALNLTPELELPEVSFDEQPKGDGIEVISDQSLENNSEEEKDEEEFLSFDEKKKLLRLKLNKEGDKSPITLKMVDELTDEEVEELKELAKLRDRKALLRFVNRKKHVTDEEAAALTDEEFLDLTNKALVMSQHLTYNPKKHFGVDYKKKRQRKNKTAKASRRANR